MVKVPNLQSLKITQLGPKTYFGSGVVYLGMQYSALLAKAHKENAQDIGLDTFPSVVSISQVRECLTKTI